MPTESTPARLGTHAVVIGGSLAGLLAARVLSDHFERVTVVERDRYPDQPGPRKGVPQARHVHLLLRRGRAILEDLFPGFDTDLAQTGAPTVDITGDIAWLSAEGWGQQFVSEAETRSCSRDLIDWHVRQRLAANPRVHFVEEHSVSGLLPDAAGTGVAGVRTRPWGGGEGAAALESDLLGDFVVDASGRNSRTPQWLPALGYAAPQETVINSFLGYATRCYAKPPDFTAPWKGLLIQSKPPAILRGGGIFPIEGDRWLVTLSGMGRDYPPTDVEGFLDFARSLRTPLLYDCIKDAEPLTGVTGYRATENRMHHYARLDRWPERFVVLGDAACAFNPVYGQGMSAAALCAVTLDACLRDQARGGNDLTGLARRFQRKLARTDDAIWLLATGEDFRCPVVEGGRPGPLVRLVHRYMDRLILRSLNHTPSRLTLLDVLHLMKPAQALFAPRVVLPALLPIRPASIPAPLPAPREEAVVSG